MKIILDAMGGDNAPDAVVRGALEAAKEFGVQIVLVGRGADILAQTSRKLASFASNSLRKKAVSLVS